MNCSVRGRRQRQTGCWFGKISAIPIPEKHFGAEYVTEYQVDGKPGSPERFAGMLLFF